MAQTSGPLTNAPFTDAQWRALVGPEPGITGDIDGSSYGITLANNSDVASIGSTSQDSNAQVGGFLHTIPAGQLEGITIPAPTTATRTDLIVLRYDPTWGAASPGPVRLFRIAGTEGAGAPTYDAAPPGVEDFPLWAVTRTVGSALSQATTENLRTRTGPNIVVRDTLPTSVPIGTQVFVTSTKAAHVRVLDAQQNPSWTRTTPAGGVLAGNTNENAILGVVHGLGYIPTKITATVVGAATDTAGVQDVMRLSDPVVWFRDASVFHVRVRRIDTGAWFANQPLTISWTAL